MKQRRRPKTTKLEIQIRYETCGKKAYWLSILMAILKLTAVLAKLVF